MTQTGPAVTPGRGPAVWTYWEDLPGRRRAVYLDLCLETIHRHAGDLEVHVLDRESVYDWLPDLDPATWERLPFPNYRSDYVRSRLLCAYGGVWVDVDTVALAPLSRLLDEVDDSGTVCWGKELGRFFGGLCAATAGAPFVEAWAEEQDRALASAEDWTKVDYALLAQNVTWTLARTHPWKAVPIRTVCPVPWYQWRRFFSRLESPGRVLSADSVAVVLWNASMGPLLDDTTRAELLVSRTLLGRLLRIGLERSPADGEEDALTALHALADLRFSLPGQRVEHTARRALELVRR